MALRQTGNVKGVPDHQPISFTNQHTLLPLFAMPYNLAVGGSSNKKPHSSPRPCGKKRSLLFLC